MKLNAFEKVIYNETILQSVFTIILFFIFAMFVILAYPFYYIWYHIGIWKPCDKYEPYKSYWGK
jgi:hypothetical protein